LLNFSVGGKPHSYCCPPNSCWVLGKRYDRRVRPDQREPATPSAGFAVQGYKRFHQSNSLSHRHNLRSSISLGSGNGSIRWRSTALVFYGVVNRYHFWHLFVDCNRQPDHGLVGATY